MWAGRKAGRTTPPGSSPASARARPTWEGWGTIRSRGGSAGATSRHCSGARRAAQPVIRTVVWGFSRRHLRMNRRALASLRAVTAQVLTTTRSGCSSVATGSRPTAESPSSRSWLSYWLTLQPKVLTAKVVIGGISSPDCICDLPFDVGAFLTGVHEGAEGSTVERERDREHNDSPDTNFLSHAASPCSIRVWVGSGYPSTVLRTVRVSNRRLWDSPARRPAGSGG